MLVPVDDRDSDISGFPEDFPIYFDPTGNFQPPTFIDPSQVYAPAFIPTTVRGSYDPNDKMVDDGIFDEINDRDINRKWLTYTIRFENLGNFSAKDVVITDILDDNLDENSVIVIEASDNVNTEMIKQADETYLLKFSFDDIFLPFDDANNDGYIKFRVKANDGVVEGTIVDNVANIYFDQNPPIITNVIQSRFIAVALDVDKFKLDAEVNIFPNPASEELQIETKLRVKNTVVYSITGQEVTSTTKNSLDVSQLNSGIYIIKVNTAKGTISKKLIIE